MVGCPWKRRCFEDRRLAAQTRQKVPLSARGCVSYPVRSGSDSQTTSAFQAFFGGQDARSWLDLQTTSDTGKPVGVVGAGQQEAAYKVHGLGQANTRPQPSKTKSDRGVCVVRMELILRQ
jgi:hypothetical protein